LVIGEICNAVSTQMQTIMAGAIDLRPGGSAVKASNYVPQLDWAIEADVVVVGLGIAGAAAAIEAADNAPGAKVLVLEKMLPDQAGGNSRASGQTFCIPQGREDFLDYQRWMNEPNPVNEEVLGPWVDEILDLEPWVRGLAAASGRDYVRLREGGAARPDFPEVPSSRCVRSYSTISPGPSGVWNTFREQVERRGIEIRYGSRVIELLQTPTREVVGGHVEIDGRTVLVKARRAVVMASGGYGANLEILRNYTGVDRVYSAGSPGSTGDGIYILQRAGADMWHLRNFTQSGGYYPGFWPQGAPTPMIRRTRLIGSSWIEIGRDGRRFHNEKAPYGSRHMKQNVNGVWRDIPHPLVPPTYMIFDQAMLDAEPLGTSSMGWAPQVLAHHWSEGNRAEVERGWIIERPTLKELAEAISVDPEVLEDTVGRYNASCRAGVDQEFSRAPDALQPIVGSRYFAIEIVPCLVNTTGGGRRNAAGQVVGVGGQAIPRLYEAGELGSLHSNLYQGGLFLAEAAASGRMAGRNAAHQLNWDERALQAEPA
jgi:succinate dehydrogenase/fumarate reductase flavoprotein subunit